VQCEKCSLVATFPQPQPSELQERYKENYYTGWDGGGGRRRLWAARLRLLRRVAVSGRLLDVGCGAGEFLNVARAAGFDATGTEFSDAARGRTSGPPVYKRPSEAPGEYDLITMWHVLEHTPSPMETLREVSAKLRPGGKFILAVPNVDSHWFDLIYRVFKGKPSALYTPETKEPHLFHFSTKTLRKALESAGYRVRWHGLDVPDYADNRKLLVDVPARLAFRLTGRNWALTQAVVAEKGGA
jgi:SAM-dependent methyltransferase